MRYPMMLHVNLTLGTQVRPDTGEVVLSMTEETLTELTRTIAAGLMARGRLHLERGEHDLALADLDASLRHDPLNAEAIVLRSQIHLKRTDHYLAYKDIETALIIAENNHEAIHTRGLLYQSTDRPEQAEKDFLVARANYWSSPGVATRSHLSAGYHVVARHAHPGLREFLISTYPLDGLSEAMADADHYAYTPEDRQRLADQGVVEHSVFEPVVYEVRSVRREVGSYCPLDDQGNYMEVGAESAQP
jgi:tetratricopeptide (TPR) repeat protein